MIYPLIALFAAIAGEDKYISAVVFPILPLKFLFVVAKQTSPSPKTPWWAPKQGPHPGVQIKAPASTKISINPSFNACLNIDFEAGITINLTSL